MSRAHLTVNERETIQQVVEQLQNAEAQEVDLFLQSLTYGNEGSVRRFLKGAYNHPVTWWIGVFQLQMQKGMWGSRRQASASMRASFLSQALRPVWNEAVGTLDGNDAPILAGIARYNLKYRKADIAGRFAGGQFTNYASTGGRFGNTRLSSNAKRVRMVTNFGIASYGAAIKAVAMGYVRVEALVQAVLTGRPENLPASYLRGAGGAMSAEEAKLMQALGLLVAEVEQLARIAPSPVPIEEFCARPENVNLAGVCK